MSLLKRNITYLLTHSLTNEQIKLMSFFFMPDVTFNTFEYGTETRLNMIDFYCSIPGSKHHETDIKVLMSY